MGPTEAQVVPYELADVVKALNDVCEFDWEPFLRRPDREAARRPAARGRRPVRLSRGLLEASPRDPSAGSRAAAAAAPRPAIRSGLSFDGEGKITDVIPGMVGDKSGLGPGMKVIGVNGKVFSAAAAPRRPGRQRPRKEDRVPPGRGGALPDGRPRLRRRPALSRAGPRHIEARPPGGDPQAARRAGEEAMIGTCGDRPTYHLSMRRPHGQDR